MLKNNLKKSWLICQKKYLVAALSVSSAGAVMQRGVYFILPPPTFTSLVMGRQF
jgi:hypothetical protein